MGILLRYIRKNMMEKKSRLILVVLSIAISAGLLVTCMGLMNTISDSFTEPGRKAAEGRDVALNAADGFWFTENDFDGDGLSQVMGEIAGTGVISKDDKLTYVSLHGRKSFDLKMVSGKFENTNEATCVISERTAKENNLRVGDTLSMNIYGIPVEFKVSGIAVTDGLLYTDTKESYSVVVPYEWMNEQSGANGAYNVMYAKVVSAKAGKDATDDEIKDAVKEFNEKNTAVKASIMNTVAVFGDMSSLYMSVGCMLAIVVIVSALIISGVFKLIITERLPVFGTFLSQGSTKGQVKRIVLLESVVYALIAGVVGCILGEGVLYAVSRYVSPLKDYGIYLPFSIDWGCIALGMAFAVVMSVVSAWKPVSKIGKLETKDVILNRVEHTHKKHVVKAVVGVLLLIGAGVASAFTHKDYTPLSILETTASYVGIILFTPALVKGFMNVLCKAFRGNTNMWLACNNIRSSKLLISNIVLLVISLNGILCCASTGVTMTKVVVEAYEEMEYDFDIENILPSTSDVNTTEQIIAELEKNEHVDAASINPVSFCIGRNEDRDLMIMGVQPKAYADWNIYMHLKDEPYRADYEDFTNTADSIVMTTALARDWKLSKGDNISVELNGTKHTFRIAAIADGKLYNGGKFILIKWDEMKNIYHSADAGSITFNVKGDPKAAEDSFKTMLAGYGATYEDRDTEMKNNVDQNAMIVDLISIFSYIAIAISAIGIFNNIVICFHQRRKEFAVMASVGMNAGKRKRLILTESMLCVAIAVAIAIPFSLLVNRLVTGMLYYMGVPFDILFDWKSTPTFLAAFAAIVFLASLSTMRKSKKLSVVTELKYE
ncbi:MAG: FtsX-like permease family protein [Lachnospiraceae bacterium]|nr:FtsX-like permease family protein [Lachnospiraceae bacterium]